MGSLDEFVKKAPEVFEIGSTMRLSKIHEYSFDDILPPFNALVMWEPPIPGFTYTIGVDLAWGIQQDRSVIHVLRNGTMKSKDCQVAEFVTDDVVVGDMAPFCYMLGNLYKDPIEDLEALMTIECNIDHGQLCNDLRNKYSYGNLFIWKYYDNLKRMMSNKLGWYTTSATRPKLINKAMQFVKHEWWDIMSPWMIAEMETIEKLEEKAQIKAALGFYDDIFMAGAIALWSAHDMEFGDFNDDLASERERRAATRMQAEEFIPGPSTRKNFQNTAISYQKMMDWEDD